MFIKDRIDVVTKDYGVELNANSNQMRDLHITDRNQGDIIATLWGGAAENFKRIENSVIVIRKAVVSIYIEKSKKINCTAGTLVWVNIRQNLSMILYYSPFLFYLHQNFEVFNNNEDF